MFNPSIRTKSDDGEHRTNSCFFQMHLPNVDNEFGAKTKVRIRFLSVTLNELVVVGLSIKVSFRVCIPKSVRVYYAPDVFALNSEIQSGVVGVEGTLRKAHKDDAESFYPLSLVKRSDIDETGLAATLTRQLL